MRKDGSESNNGKLQSVSSCHVVRTQIQDERGVTGLEIFT